VELLSANHADVNAKDNAGYASLDNGGATPLHYAADRGHQDVVELLLTSKAEVNARDSSGDTPLKRAAYMGHRDVAALLLASGAIVDAQNKWGMTPLDEAANGG
jgi:ankyrin repeat protein